MGPQKGPEAPGEAPTNRALLYSGVGQHTAPCRFLALLGLPYQALWTLKQELIIDNI